MEWKKFADETPKRGCRFITLYEDGSGSCMYFLSDAGELIDQDGDPDSLESLGGELENYWAYLPDDYALSFEDVWN